MRNGYGDATNSPLTVSWREGRQPEECRRGALAFGNVVDGKPHRRLHVDEYGQRSPSRYPSERRGAGYTQRAGDDETVAAGASTTLAHMCLKPRQQAYREP